MDHEQVTPPSRQRPKARMSTVHNFHPGEVQLQTESGVDTAAFDKMVDHAFRPEMNHREAQFVTQRTFSTASTIDEAGRPWASPLLSQSLELFSVLNPTTILITPTVVTGDPLLENIAKTSHLGVLFFDPARRQRAKSLGKGTISADESIRYQTQRFYGLCNKYIFKRSHDPSPDNLVPATEQSRSDSQLNDKDRLQLESADTIFLASYHHDHGADPTHRGGPPGFVSVIDNNNLQIPDYMGNGMFQTLGNLLLDNRLGITSVDFATGRTVHITGTGTIVPSAPDNRFSERTLHMEIDEVRTTWHNAGEWTDIGAFELRPGLINPATPYLPATAD